MWVIYEVGWFVEVGIDNAYAQWGAGEMLVQYMKDHDDVWPTGWEDLRKLYEARGGHLGGDSFEDYQQRIRIDWHANPAELHEQAMTHDHPTFDVVGLADGSSVSWEGASGNEIVYHYLRGDVLPTIKVDSHMPKPELPNTEETPPR